MRFKEHFPRKEPRNKGMEIGAVKIMSEVSEICLLQKVTWFGGWDPLSWVEFWVIPGDASSAALPAMV